MKEILESILVIIFIGFLCFMGGVFLAFESAKNSLIKDCKTMGQFRDNDSLYECRIKR